MGFLRGAGVVIVSIFLLVAILASNVLFVLGASLQYNNVKAGLSPLVQQMAGINSGNNPAANIPQNANVTQFVQQYGSQAAAYCQNHTGYNFSYNGYNIDIPCSGINTTNPDPQQIINQSFDSLVSALYYKQYGCSFTQCFSTVNPPLFLVSQMSQQYFIGKFYIAIIISVILIALLLLAVLRKRNALIIIGSLMIATGIFVLKVISTVSSLLGQFAFLISIFVATAKITFWFSLILGVALLCTGIALKIWGKKSEKANTKQRK